MGKSVINCLLDEKIKLNELTILKRYINILFRKTLYVFIQYLLKCKGESKTDFKGMYNMTEQNNILSIINGEHWIFAKTYANSNPHEYIVRSKCSSVDIFDCLCEYIKKNGHKEYFYNHMGIYVSIGDYTYWQMGDVINRRWNDMYNVDKVTKQITKVENWKELLKDGRVLHK